MLTGGYNRNERLTVSIVEIVNVMQLNAGQSLKVKCTRKRDAVTYPDGFTDPAIEESGVIVVTRESNSHLSFSGDVEWDAPAPGSGDATSPASVIAEVERRRLEAEKVGGE